MDTSGSSAPPPIAAEIVDYYTRRSDASRLSGSPAGALEFLRTMEILLRHIPPPPAVVLDVGGGAGIYACPLARLGYTVHLIDAVALHIEQAREASAAQPDHPLASAEVGDARALPQPDDTAGAVLLLGPLYHLTERRDRLQALREARRVLLPGGVLFAAGVTKFASLLDGLRSGMFGDPDFAAIVEGDLRDGQHRNATGRPYWTTAFFHHPDQLRDEVRDAGLALIDVLAIEGLIFAVRDPEEWWSDQARRDQLLALVRAVEHEPSLMGMGPHVMAVARKEAASGAR